MGIKTFVFFQLKWGNNIRDEGEELEVKFDFTMIVFLICISVYTCTPANGH